MRAKYPSTHACLHNDLSQSEAAYLTNGKSRIPQKLGSAVAQVNSWRFARRLSKGPPFIFQSWLTTLEAPSCVASNYAHHLLHDHISPFSPISIRDGLPEIRIEPRPGDPQPGCPFCIPPSEAWFRYSRHLSSWRKDANNDAQEWSDRRNGALPLRLHIYRRCMDRCRFAERDEREQWHRTLPGAPCLQGSRTRLPGPPSSQSSVQAC